MHDEPIDPDGPVLPPPLEQAVEVFVYAPLGFLLGARREFPAYVARGRREIGRFQQKLGRRMQAAARESSAAVRGLGLTTATPSARDDDEELVPTSEPPNLSVVPSVPDVGVTDRTPPVAASVEPDTDIVADELAIPGYESLSASQVVPRLVSLSAEELELIRQYEAAVRGRKTILSRIAQLQAG